MLNTHTIVRRLALLFAATMAASVLLSPPASANGPCGQNFDGEHACAVTSPYSANGALVTSNDHDYYLFYAAKGTEISVTIKDDTNPETCPANHECGFVAVEFDDSTGNEVGYNSASSDINNGIVVPGSFNYTIEESGTYYLIVSGHEEPYTLTVTASPNVVWPPPAPPPAPAAAPPPAPAPPPACAVPAVHHNESLAAIEHAIVAANCTVGRVVHIHAAHVRRGDVISLSARSGIDLAHDAAVTVTVSSGPAPRRKPKPRHSHRRRRRRRRR